MSQYLPSLVVYGFANGFGHKGAASLLEVAHLKAPLGPPLLVKALDYFRFAELRQSHAICVC